MRWQGGRWGAEQQQLGLPPAVEEEFASCSAHIPLDKASRLNQLGKLDHPNTAWPHLQRLLPTPVPARAPPSLSKLAQCR